MCWALTAAAAAVIGCQQAQSTELTPADITALKAAPVKWTSSQMASDWAAMETMLAENIALYPPNGAPVEGKANALAFLKGFPKLTVFTAHSMDTGGNGDIGYDRGTYTFTTAEAPGAPSMTESGTYIAISQREADGSWKVLKDIWHSDAPAPAAPAAKK